MNNSKYDAWLHWNVTNRCNLKCEYCFSVPPKPKNDVNRINISKLLATLEKTDKTFRIGFTGGEPFLVPNFVEAVKSITKKHFVTINSNLTLPTVKDFGIKIHHERVLFIHASFHYLELIRKKVLDNYISNFFFLRENGFNVYAEEVAFPPHLERLEKDAERLSKLGIKLKFGAYYGFYNGKRYPESYTDEEIERFNLPKREIEKFRQKGNYCNAGYNVGVVYSKGQIKPCFQYHSDLGNIYEEINFNSELIRCEAEYCGCPMNLYDLFLYNKALRIKGSKVLKTKNPQ